MLALTVRRVGVLGFACAILLIALAAWGWYEAPLASRVAIGLPDGDGYKLLQRIRQRGATVPAIALTAYARIEDRRRALSAGFQFHMAKPIEPRRLVDAVSSICAPTELAHGPLKG